MKHLTKKQLRAVLKQCAEFTLNGYRFTVVFQSNFDYDLDVKVLTGEQLNASRCVRSFSAQELLSATIDKQDPDALVLATEFRLQFFRTDLIKLN